MEDDKALSEIVRSATRVFNILGYGYFWEIYRNALFVELNEKGIKYEKVVSFPVTYKEKSVGNFTVDIVVDERIIVQIVRDEKYSWSDELQMNNFLRASGLEKGIVFHFGSSFSFKVLQAPEKVAGGVGVIG